jgi:dienelactone hydrolase
MTEANLHTLTQRLERLEYKNRWPPLERAVGGVLALLLLAGCASLVRFPTASPESPVRLSATLYRPRGVGPFPAVVLLHTCAGVQPHVLGWAQWLTADGYVAMVVDSFSPRSVRSVCGRGTVSTVEVAWDAFGALAYLRSLPFVDRERVGVMGWSWGATAALKAARKPFITEANPPGVLLLMGAQDDLSPPYYCLDVAKRLQASGRPVSWVVYPGARHGFDQAELGGKTFDSFGHALQYDPVATRDSEKRVREFLRQNLSSGQSR